MKGNVVLVFLWFGNLNLYVAYHMWCKVLV